MKTAMMELIEDLKAIGVKIRNADAYLEKEKEHIRKAYMEGKWHEGSGTLSEINMTGEDYYIQTYPKTNPIDNP